MPRAIAPIETIYEPARRRRHSVIPITPRRNAMPLHDLLRSLLAAYAGGASGRCAE